MLFWSPLQGHTGLSLSLFSLFSLSFLSHFSLISLSFLSHFFDIRGRLTEQETIDSLGLKLRDAKVHGAMFNRKIVEDREAGRLAGLLTEALQNPFSPGWRVVISDATSIGTAQVVKGILKSLAQYLKTEPDVVDRFTVFPLFETEADIERGTAYLTKIKEYKAKASPSSAEREELREFDALVADKVCHIAPSRSPSIGVLMTELMLPL